MRLHCERDFLGRSPLLSVNLHETARHTPGIINPRQHAVYHEYNIYEQYIVFISTFLLPDCLGYQSRLTSVNSKAINDYNFLFIYDKNNGVFKLET